MAYEGMTIKEYRLEVIEVLVGLGWEESTARAMVDEDDIEEAFESGEEPCDVAYEGYCCE